MKKLTVTVLLLLFFLSSCGTALPEAPKKVEKIPFFIETLSLGKKKESYTVEKSARITAGSSLTLSAEWVGEVSGIYVKEWSKIRSWNELISLRDTINSYDIRVAQAENGVVIQDASIENTKVNLDRSVVDSQIAYEQAKKNYDTIIAKTTLSYDTIVNSNQKTLDNLEANYKLYLADIEKNMDQILYESDKILGISFGNEHINDNFREQLGGKLPNLRYTSNESYKWAYEKLKIIKNLKLKITTPDTAKSDIENIEQAYTLISKHLDDMIYMIQNNITIWEITVERNNWWINQFNWFRSAVNGANTGFVQWKLQTLTFLKNYKQNELATKVAIESLDRKLSPEEESLIAKSPDAKLLYTTTIIDLKDRITSAKLSLRQAENARQTAEKSRDTTLAQLAATRQWWVLTLEQARREYAKLSITAPFDGTVSKVIATSGQRVSPGSPLIEVVSNSPEVQIELDADIINSISLGDSVSIEIEKYIFTGSVTALSKVAWTNLLYTTRISVPRAIKYIGSAANIVFTASRAPQDTIHKTIILPLKSIKIISEQEWEIALLSTGNTILYKSVKLWKPKWENIEILESLDPKWEVILTDVSNFDPSKYILTKKVSK